MRLSDAPSFGCRSCVLWGGGGLQARFFAHTSPGRAVSCVPGRGSGTCAVHGSSVPAVQLFTGRVCVFCLRMLWHGMTVAFSCRLWYGLCLSGID